MSGAIMLRNVWMVGRYIGDALVELSDGVPSVAHDVRNEAIGIAERTLRPVDEPGLYRAPLLCVAFARACR
ncbi:MAG: hypothetical protein JOZ38_03010 [Candidatus Eremiobacteraeota bacterium]|nr:hypothetical protein [Candidatus Eremiobacteraeota bacterium]